MLVNSPRRTFFGTIMKSFHQVKSLNWGSRVDSYPWSLRESEMRSSDKYMHPLAISSSEKWDKSTYCVSFAKLRVNCATSFSTIKNGVSLS